MCIRIMSVYVLCVCDMVLLTHTSYLNLTKQLIYYIIYIIYY